jgi:hypothetical protein
VSVHVEFRCGGCDAVASGTRFITRPKEKVFGGGRGGFYRTLPWDVDDVVPEGWVASDPYTGCCYCPKCWAEIEEIDDRREATPPRT